MLAPSRMKAWQVDFGGGLDSLRLVDLPTPEPGPHEVLVRVRAVSLNPRELLVLDGRYPLPVNDTLIPACDGAGEVVEIGTSVTKVSRGDRVIGAVFPEWVSGDFSLAVAGQLGGSLDGMLADYVVLPEHAALTIPAGLSFDEAACLPCAGVTAWHAVTAGGSTGAGHRVLSLTGGAISSFAIQFATHLGAEVIATTSSPKRESALLALGASHVVGTGGEADLPDEVLALTDGRGVDQVIHVHGSLADSVSATRVAGTIELVSTGEVGTLDPAAMFARNLTIRSISLGSVEHTRDMLAFLAEHDITIPIAATLPFGETRAAYETALHGTSLGKVVIVNET